MKGRLILMVVIGWFSVQGWGQEVWPSGTAGVGGSYNLTFPPGPYTYPYNPPTSCATGAPAASFYQYPGANYFRDEVASPKVVSGFSQVPQTHDWWSSAIWNYETTCNWVIAPYSFWMFPHPLIIGANEYGLKISYENNPTIVNGVSGTYHYFGESHLSIGLQGMDVPASKGTQVKSYSDWAVTLDWNDGAHDLQATAAHGSPYVYFTKDASSSFTIRYEINPPNTIYKTINNGNVYAIGVQMNLNGITKYYGVFMPPGSNLSGYYGLTQSEAAMAADKVPLCCVTRDAQTVTTPAGQNYMSVAVLPDSTAATLAYYAKYAFAFITDTEVSWSYNTTASQANSTFTVTTSPQGSSTETGTLLALYRHQWLNTAAPLTSYTYASPRGSMKVVQGNSFSTAITQYGLLSGLPNLGTNKTTLYNYVDAVYRGTSPEPADTSLVYEMNYKATLYDMSVKTDRMIDLIHVADVAGHSAAKAKFISDLKTGIEHWLQAPNGKSDQMFWYDPLWKTLVAYPSGFESDRQLNDHHFHYGYIIKGAAAIVQYEPDNTWLTQWGPMVEMLIKDVANWDKTDTQFPFLRFFDPYAGHSWASGHSNFQNGNNQESSSEALNFAAGVALYGTNSGNATLRDLGMFLYSTEAEAVQQYWFNTDNAVFPSGYSNVAAGILWGWGTDYQTWFGNSPQYVHAINYLPITGSSFYLAWDSLYPPVNYAGMVANNGGLETAAGTFQDLFWMYQALFDPATALGKFNTNVATYTPQVGQSRPFTYLWISMLDSIGKPYNVTANVPTYSVFRKGSCITYIVYNPPSNVPGNPYAGPKTVTFSDGFSASVPSDTTIVFRRCLNALPIDFQSLTASVENLQVELNWTTTNTLNLHYFDIERSTDGKNWISIGTDYSTSNQHTYWDKDALSGIVYYRIKVVNTNGQYFYSDIRSVNIFGSKKCISYTYNPIAENLNFNLTCNGEYDISIYEVTGKLVDNAVKVNGEGQSQCAISLSGKSSGVYLVRVNGVATLAEKVVKQ